MLVFVTLGVWEVATVLALGIFATGVVATFFMRKNR